MIISRIVLLLAIVVSLISCSSQQNRDPAIGQAFVGPSTLNLRKDLSTKSPVSAVLRHGEPLDILEYKRRFIKVRTAGGITGWTDTRQLLTPAQMAELRHSSENSSRFPSQGVATTFEPLNIHTEPNRLSPSFLQIPEGGKVEVIGHRITPRVQAAPPLPTPPPRPKTIRHKPKHTQSAKISPPPMPDGPKPPANWLELSKPAPVAVKPVVPAAPPAPVHMDDWSLVRAKDGTVGWALSRMISMAIPDDVAQYAEGHRITSYFPIGEVQDDNQVHHNWLWTTIGKGPQPYEFDSFRFFIWSKRHHRYETAYIQRDVVGHYPVTVDTASPNPSFSVILEQDDGKLVKKTYAFNGYRVSLASAVPYTPPGSNPTQPVETTAAPNPSVQKAQSWMSGLAQRFTSFFHK